MINFKRLYNQANFDLTVEKQILNRNFYYKYYIKAIRRKKKGGILLDNFFSINKAVKLPSFYTNLIFKKKNIAGYSIVIKDFFFKSIRSKNLVFRAPYFYYSCLGNSKLLALKNSLNVLKKNKKENKKRNKIKKKFRKYKYLRILIVSAVKGGFTIYCWGILGFMPFRQFRRKFFKVLKKSRYFRRNYLACFTKRISRKHVLVWWKARVVQDVIRCPLKIIKKKRRKKKRFAKRSNLNFVFLSRR
jgi:hypothetical protein